MVMPERLKNIKKLQMVVPSMIKIILKKILGDYLSDNKVTISDLHLYNLRE